MIRIPRKYTSERCGDREASLIFHCVFDVVGLIKAGELERPAPLQLVLHRFKERRRGAVCAAKDSAVRHNAANLTTHLPTSPWQMPEGAGREAADPALGLLLNLKFRNENGRRDRGNRYAARFRAAIPVEYFRLIRGRENPCEACEGVPTISTPLTSSSGRPSGYTRYTISGMTLK